jgi:O-antigen/teichoic acid export membrane protein
LLRIDLASFTGITLLQSGYAFCASLVHEKVAGMPEDSINQHSGSQQSSSGMPTQTSDGKAMRQALIWSGGAQILTQAASFVVFLLVANTLPKEVIGAFAFALVLIDALTLTGKSALMDALIMRQDFSRRAMSSFFWVGMGGAATCGVVMAALAIPLAQALAMPQLSGFLPALAASVLFVPFLAVMEAQLIQRLQLRSMAFRNSIAVGVGGLAATACLFGPAPEWALVAQRFGQYLASLCFLWFATRFLPLFPRAGFLLGQGQLRQTSALWRNHFLAQFASRAIDGIIAGGLGAQAIGAMRVVSRFPELLQQPVVGPFFSLVIPLLSRLKGEREAAIVTFLDITRVLALISLPVFAGLACVSLEVVQTFLNDTYAGYWPVLAAVALAGMSSPVMGMRTQLMSVTGGARTLTYLILFDIVSVLIVTPMLLGFGLVGVAWGILGLTVVHVAVSLTVILRRLQCGVARYFGAILPVLLAIGYMVSMVFAVRTGLAWAEISFAAPVRLALFATVGASAYLAWLWLIHRGWVLQVSRLLRAKH